MAGDLRTLITWIRRQTENRDAAAVLALRQVVGGQASANVEEWPRPWSDLTVLAGDIVDTAQSDADAVGPGVYGYALCVCDASGRVLTRRPFRVVAQDDMGAAVGPSEPANATGVLAQLMRFMEARERLQTAGELRVLDRYEKLLEKSEKRVEHLEGREAEVMRLFEELISKRAAREIELIKVQTDAKAKGDFAEKITSLLPHAAATLGLAPPDGDPEVKALVDTLVKEQVPIEGLLNAIPPRAQLYLASILKRYIPAPKPADPDPEKKAN